LAIGNQFGPPFSFSPLAIRAFKLVFDERWRVGVRGLSTGSGWQRAPITHPLRTFSANRGGPERATSPATRG